MKWYKRNSATRAYGLQRSGPSLIVVHSFYINPTGWHARYSLTGEIWTTLASFGENINDAFDWAENYAREKGLA